VEEYFLMPDDDVDLDRLSPWVLRIELNRELFYVKTLSMEEIANLITDFFGKGVHVIHTDDNDERLVLRIRIIISEEDKLAEAEEIATGSEDQIFLRQMQNEMLENYIYVVSQELRKFIYLKRSFHDGMTKKDLMNSGKNG